MYQLGRITNIECQLTCYSETWDPLIFLNRQVFGLYRLIEQKFAWDII